MRLRKLSLVVLPLMALALVVSPLTAEAKAKKAKPNREKAAIKAKYDTNKDGKLSKGEKAAIPAAELAKLGGKKKK